MKLQVLYFARVRERIGLDGEAVEGAFATLADVRAHLLAQPGHEVLGELKLMCARNEELCSLATPVADGDTLAFFPTVTGG